MINLKYEISYHVSTSKLISDMNERDHIAANCTKDAEIEEIITNFVLRGIMHNQINFWLVKKYEKEIWLAILKKAGIDVNCLINSQELIILDSDEIFSEAPFSFNPIHGHLENLKSLIRDKQKSGINVIGTLAGTLFSQARFSDCTNIERNWHEVIETFEIPITLLCLYNSSMSEKYQSVLIGVHNVGMLTISDGILENKNQSHNIPKWYCDLIDSLSHII